jgi:hypothetical protein
MTCFTCIERDFFFLQSSLFSGDKLIGILMSNTQGQLNFKLLVRWQISLAMDVGFLHVEQHSSSQKKK